MMSWWLRRTSESGYNSPREAAVIPWIINEAFKGGIGDDGGDDSTRMSMKKAEGFRIRIIELTN